MENFPFKKGEYFMMQKKLIFPHFSNFFHSFLSNFFPYSCVFWLIISLSDETRRRIGSSSGWAKHKLKHFYYKKCNLISKRKLKILLFEWNFWFKRQEVRMWAFPLHFTSKSLRFKWKIVKESKAKNLFLLAALTQW